MTVCFLTSLLRASLALGSLLLAAGCATVSTPAPPSEPIAANLSTPLPPAPAVAPVIVASPEPAAPTPLAPSGPRGRTDPAQDAERGDLWERVRDGFAMADVDNELVRKWEAWYARDPAYVQRMTERGGRYLFHILEEVQRREMPTELALLPFIESAFNPQAQSRARAMGMWQFMPATGKDFDLRQNLFRDDRRDVLASTRAALDYLQRLNGLFKDWHLALAAYNWGQGNVSRALERNRRAGLPLSYEALRMPNETRDYVPKLQAVKNIVLRPEAFALRLQPLENHPFFLSVAIERDIDVALAATLAGVTVEEFQQLNPQMNKPVILAAGTPQVLLPYDNANRFIREVSQHQGAMATWTAWVAPRTLQPAEAARLIGMPEPELREVNRIPARMLVKAGSTLLVPRRAHTTADVAEHVADHALLSLAPESPPRRRITIKASRQGESVSAVAARHGVSAVQLAQWNGVSPQARFKGGQTIVVEVPAAARRVASRSTGTAAGSKVAASRSTTAAAGSKSATTAAKGRRQVASAAHPVRR